MSLEEDMVQATTELVAEAKEQITFLAQITSDTPLEAKVDGSSIAIPCIRTDGTEMTIGKQVVLLKVGPKFYVVGALGTYVPPDIPTVPESKVFSAILATDLAYGTSATTTLTVAALDVGNYSFRAHQGWTYVGTTDQNVTVDFTGTATGTWDLIRYSGSANAGSFTNALGDEVGMGQTTPQALDVNGVMVVTVAGDLRLRMRRNAGTSALAKAGASLVVTKV